MSITGSFLSLKQKDLIGIPWMVAFALRADGWFLRSDILWTKKNPMPESVTDRPSRAHEYVFLLAHPESEGQYFYDHEAVREPVSEASIEDGRMARGERGTKGEYGAADGACGFNADLKRNRRTVWQVNPKPYAGSHFACWPEALVEPMIRAGTSEHGVCPSCSSPWERVVIRADTQGNYTPSGGAKAEASQVLREAGGLGRLDGGRRSAAGSTFNNNPAKRGTPETTTTWLATCKCPEEVNLPIPATVLDIFSGSATTGKVALDLGRHYVGLDINSTYLPLAEHRILDLAPVDTRANQDADEGFASVLDMFGSDDSG